MALLNKDNINAIVSTAHLLTMNVSTLEYNIRNKRVSHTVRSIIQCSQRVLKLVGYAQSDNNFSKHLKQALDKAYDPKGGSMAVEIYDDNTIFIRGSFDIEELRKRIMTVPLNEDTKPIETEYVNGK